ncbi:MAG TPA: GGDEF domain-containing protein, partial [Thermoanaerobaculia bacterium]|nr:GGDEF domain-containing protein [Thermoanaerobaculia bacterium]
MASSRRLRARLLDGVAAAESFEEVARAVVGELSSWFPHGAWAAVLDGSAGALALSVPPLGTALRRALQRLAAEPAERRVPRFASALAEEPLWAEDLRPFAAAGFAAAWAVPVDRGVDDGVNAWIVLLHDGKRLPSAEHRGVMELAAALAGVAFAAFDTRRQVLHERFFDPLTRLSNRRRFHHELERGLVHADPGQARLAVLLVDLDRFGVINETLGLAVGDALLLKVAERLSDFVGSQGLVARFGDDEFALLMTDAGGEASLERNCRDLLRRLGRPHDFGGEEMFASASVGVSVYPWHGEDAEGLIRSAEKALAVAKRKGRNRHQLYSPVLGTADYQNLQLLSGLPDAAARGELELLYQALVSAEDGEVVGAE